MAKGNQDNKTVSFGDNDTDIIRYLNKLKKPFSTYVKELIRKDMNKGLDDEFKESLRATVIDVVKEALDERPGKKENKVLKEMQKLLSSINDIEDSDEESSSGGFRTFENNISAANSKPLIVISPAVVEEVKEDNMQNKDEELAKLKAEANALFNMQE